MSSEIVLAAVYLANRNPRKKNDWQTPEGKINSWLNKQSWTTHQRSETPQLAHLKRYGCRAYPLTTSYKKGENKSHKTDPRAHIGYLCGYESTNIFRIWIPALDKVMRTRDVTFDETVMYDPNAEDTSLLHQQELQRQFNEHELLMKEIDQEERPLDSRLWDDDDFTYALSSAGMISLQNKQAIPLSSYMITPQHSPTPEDQSHISDRVDSSTEGVNNHSPTDEFQSRQTASESTQTAQTPESTLEAEDSIIVQTDEPSMSESDRQPQSRLRGRPRGSQNNMQTTTGQVNRQIPEATRSSRRERKASQRYSNTSFFHTTDSVKEKEAMDNTAQSLGKLHRNQLLPAPKSCSEAKSHKFWIKWLAAMNIEYRTVWQRGTFDLTDLDLVDQETHRVLPLKWVLSYKFDKHGYLQKFKARICVRGDLQPINSLEIYASTLVGRSFRSLMVIVARFNLDTVQLDAINTFINSRLDEVVYMWFPPGYQRPGKCLKLMKSLYGLRRSPLLWQQDLTETLKRMNLKPLDDDDCIYIT
ncbi:reverse transcriptase domain protein [Colletotrichum kahawae]|uniref:Reverse transcriptase domain protein n=1 Tax=Colletotrichum kahawae TaxID=34407 RepID=A0AAD9YK06_COLKA|nr:reverse transcriptase domain protein [Colletotrichum kahawae]